MEKKEQYDTAAVRREAAALLRDNGRYFVSATLCVLLSIIASYIVPLINSFTLDYVIGGDLDRAPALIAGLLERIGGRDYLMYHLYWCALCLVLVTALNGCMNYLRRRQMAEASERIAHDLRTGLYRHLEDLPFDYHKHASTGDLIQRCTSDVNTVRRFVSMQLMEIVRVAVMIVVAMVIMWGTHPVMTLISMATVPLMLVGSFVYFRFVRRYFKIADEAEATLSTMLQENLTGIRVVRAFGQQKKQLDRFTEANGAHRNENLRILRLLALYWCFSDAVGYLQIAVTLITGVVFAVRGEMTVGMVSMFVSYAGMLNWPVRQLGRILAELGKASVALGRITEVLAAEPECEPGAALTPDLRGDIEFKNVCFGYDSEDDVLKGITFKARWGETIGILGSTGSGKSSLVQLLQRLYTATKGQILINGTEINEIDHAYLRRNIGIVLQEPFLYSRSILDNIRIVRPDAPMEEVQQAARIAAVHDVITSFDDGYDTMVGERGVTLSGGQQQRVSIARTLMGNAPILIFDDSMSAVDTETDAAIRDALHAMHHEGIVFIISHRITTLCEADRILVLEDGNLVQQGTHNELMKQPGLYSRIAGIQDYAAEEGGDSFAG